MKQIVIVLIFSILHFQCLKAQKSPYDIGKQPGLSGYFFFLLSSNSSSITISGQITGFTSGTMVLYNNKKDEFKINPAKNYSISISKNTEYSLSLKSNPSGLLCSIENASGVATADITNANISCSEITSVKLVYSPGNWNDYIKNDGTDRLSASNVACDGTESGNYYQACIHTGEIRKLEIPNKSSCSGLTIADNASSGGALNWNCKENSSGTSLTVYSTGLRKGKYLSDLIDWSLSSPDWKSLKLIITEGTTVFFESTASKWWTNQIINNTDTGFVSGAVHTYTSSQLNAPPINPGVNLNFISLTVSKAALVAKPGLTMFRTSSNSVSLIQAISAGQKFLWLEGVYDADNNDGGLAIGASTKFLVLKNFVIQNSSQSRATPTNASIALSGQKNLLEDVRIMNGKHQGLALTSSSTSNLIINLVSANNNFNGIHLSAAGAGNFFLNTITSNNGPRGVLFQSGANSNYFMNLTTINNNASGLMFFTNCNLNFVGNILSLNNSTTGIENSASNNNTIFNLVSSNNNTASALAQLVSATASYSGNTLTGVFKVSGLNNTACNALGTPTGIGFTNTCSVEGASDFTASFNIDTISGIFPDGGKSTSDSVNSSFSSGTATFSTSLNWSSFENNFRFIGKSGSAFPDLTNAQRGNCATGDTCQIWDTSLKQTDTIARDVNSCPTATSFITHDSITFLKNAYEILGDSIGDDDGFCESNESCIFTPNIGAYQGHSSIIPASQTTSSTKKCTDIGSGTISNVKLYKFEKNGY